MICYQRVIGHSSRSNSWQFCTHIYIIEACSCSKCSNFSATACTWWCICTTIRSSNQISVFVVPNILYLYLCLYLYLYFVFCSAQNGIVSEHKCLLPTADCNAINSNASGRPAEQQQTSRGSALRPAICDFAQERACCSTFVQFVFTRYVFVEQKSV